MEQKLIRKFKEKWKKINILEENQLRKLTPQEKLYQLASIIRLAAGLKLDFNEDSEKDKVRSIWVSLKRNAR